MHVNYKYACIFICSQRNFVLKNATYIIDSANMCVCINKYFVSLLGEKGESEKERERESKKMA